MNYLAELAGWALLQAAWQTLAIWLLLRTILGLTRTASAAQRHRCAELHLLGAAGAVALTLGFSHVSVAAHSALTAHDPSRETWLVQAQDRIRPLLAPLGWSWLASIVVAQVALLAGCIRASRSIKSGAPVTRDLQAIVEEISLSLRLRRRVRAVCSGDIHSPMIVGWRCVCLVVPAGFAETHPRDERRALLAHELAHAARGDYARNILHLSALSVLWWHPGAWLMYAAIRHERECASDDMAVRIIGARVPLASALLRLAAASVPAQPLLVTAGSGRLADRISRISNPGMDRCASREPVIAAGVVAALTLVSGVAGATASSGAVLARDWAGSWFAPPTVFTIQAHDPAGTFLVKMIRGRVVAIVVGQSQIPADRVTQSGAIVTVTSDARQELLRLEVDARGGFRWRPRQPSR